MVLDEKLRWSGFWMVDSLQGGPTKKYYDKIKNSYLKGTSIEETDEKLKKLIAHAVNTTEFYKDFDENTPLERLPVVNKDTIRNQYESFYSSTYRDVSDNRQMSTSGSTGTPFRIIQNKDKIIHNRAAGIFMGVLGNYYIGMKQAFIRMWVGDHAKQGKLSLLAQNLIMMDCANIGEEELEKRVQFLKDKKVTSIIGYSSAIGDISRYIEKHHVDTSGFSVKSIIPISESMPETVRHKLEEQFGCPVQAWYSNEENGIMGIQDRNKERYYIDTESYYYEILKMDCDEPAEPGELGRIVITDLYNYALPMIRYDNGDMAICERKEKNGRYRLYLTELYGRRADIIYDTEGKYVSPFILFNNLAEAEGIKQYRFIQEDETHYTLWLNGEKEKIDAEGIVKLLIPYLGAKAELAIDYVDEIPTLNSGKRKYIENRCEKYKK